MVLLFIETLILVCINAQSQFISIINYYNSFVKDDRNIKSVQEHIFHFTSYSFYKRAINKQVFNIFSF